MIRNTPLDNVQIQNTSPLRDNKSSNVDRIKKLSGLYVHEHNALTNISDLNAKLNYINNEIKALKQGQNLKASLETLFQIGKQLSLTTNKRIGSIFLNHVFGFVNNGFKLNSQIMANVQETQGDCKLREKDFKSASRSYVESLKFIKNNDIEGKTRLYVKLIESHLLNKNDINRFLLTKSYIDNMHKIITEPYMYRSLFAQGLLALENGNEKIAENLLALSYKIAPKDQVFQESDENFKILINYIPLLLKGNNKSLAVNIIEKNIHLIEKKKEEKPIEIENFYHELGNKFIENSNIKEGIKYLQASMNLAENLYGEKNDITQDRIYNFADKCNKTKQYSLAVENYLKFISSMKNSNLINEKLFQSFWQLGNINEHYFDDKDKAIINYQKALKVCERINLPDDKYIEIATKLLSLHSKTNSLSKEMEEILNKRLNLLNNTDPIINQLSTEDLTHYGKYFINKKDYSKARNCIKLAIEKESEKNPKSILMIELEVLRGDIEQRESKFNKSDLYYTNAVIIYEDDKTKAEIETLDDKKKKEIYTIVHNAYDKLGYNAFKHKNDITLAPIYWEKAVELVPKKINQRKNNNDVRNGMCKSLGNASFCYFKSKNYDKAVKCLENSIRIKAGLAEKDDLLDIGTYSSFILNGAEDDKNDLANQLGNLGVSLVRSGSYSSALKLYHTLANFVEEFQGNSSTKGYVYLFLGRLAMLDLGKNNIEFNRNVAQNYYKIGMSILKENLDENSTKNLEETTKKIFSKRQTLINAIGKTISKIGTSDSKFFHWFSKNQDDYKKLIIEDFQFFNEDLGRCK